MKSSINIAVCDDEHSFIEVIKKRLGEILKGQREYTLSVFDKGKDLMDQYKKQVFDTVLLDIDMPEISGFEIAAELQKINKNVIIVFITSHEDKVFQSWEYQPFWFVRKTHLNDLEFIMPRLLTKIDSIREEENGIFSLFGEKEAVEIDVNAVKYIQAYRHYIILKDKDKKDLQIRCKISEAERQLSSRYFVRIQKGIIINCRFISKITSREVILLDGEKLHISRDKIEYTKEEFQKFVRSRR